MRREAERAVELLLELPLQHVLDLVDFVVDSVHIEPERLRTVEL